MKVKAKKSWLAVGAGMLAGALAITGVSLLNHKPMTALAAGEGRVLYYVDCGYLAQKSDGTGDIITRMGTPGYPATVTTPFMTQYGLSFGTGANDTTKLYNSVTDKPYSDAKWEWGTDYNGDNYTYSYQGAYADSVTGKEWGFYVTKNSGSDNAEVNSDYGWNNWRTWGCESDAVGFTTSRHTENGEGSLTYKFEVDNDTDDLVIRWGSMITSDWNAETYPVHVNGDTTKVYGSENDVQVQALKQGTPSYYKWTPVVHGVEENGKYYVTIEFDRGRNTCVFINYIMVTTADYEFDHDEAVSYSASTVVKGSNTISVVENGICPMPYVEATIKEASKSTIAEATDFTVVNDIAIEVNGKEYTVSALVVPEETVYFVNAGSKFDRLYTADNGYGWTSCVGDNKPAWQDQAYEQSGRYTGGTINYQFDNLPAGVYGVKVGSYGHWSMGRTMEITVNDVQGDNLVVTSNTPVNKTYYTVLNAAGQIELEIAPETGKSGADPVITYIQIFKHEEHSIGSKVEGTPADCTTAGTKDYYPCTECGLKFADDAGTELLTDLTIPAINHANKVHHEATGDCSEPGTIEYWECPDCNKKFSDVDCTQEVEDINRDVGHTIVHVEAKDPTCTEAGEIEHYTCTVCHKNFSDEQGDQELDSIAGEAAKGHDYDYENAVWAWNGYESATLTATCKHDSNHTDVKTAEITSEVTTEATETEDGERTYTATVTVGDQTYTDTKTEVIPKTGTDSGEEPPVEEPPVETPKKKGCKSSISASLAIVGGMLAAGTVAIAIKKRKNDK